MSKQIITLLAIFTLNFNAWSASPSVVPVSPTAGAAINPVSPEDQLRIAQMKFYVSLTPEKYEELRDKKLNFLERFSFKVSQKRMKKMLKHYDNRDTPTTLQKISWFTKGLILGPIALILGYIFLKDEERELIKWIWFGFAGFAIIVVAILLAL